MKRIFLVLFLALLFFYAVNTSWAIGAKPAPQTKDTIAVKTTVKTAKAKPDSVKAKPAKPVRLVDLGANKCVPCKMMAPILEGLEKEYQGKMQVVVIDVWQNADEGSKYKIRVIPTQIFYSPEGKELFRHEGFYSRDDILKKWKELGYDFSTGPEKEKKP